MNNIKKTNDPKISVVIITKNEEENIVACLETVKWADEIIIVDSLSTDRTVELAKNYTDKVFSRPFKNYADQKNFAGQQASQPWILSIDADERVLDELKKEIIGIVKQDKIDGCRIPRLDYMFGKIIKYGGWYFQPHIRLFKTDKAQWFGEVHESVIVNGKVGSLKNPLLHYSHLTISHFVQKLDCYTTIEANANHQKGIKPNIFNILFIPWVVFLYKYFYKLGFLDGIHGLVLATSLAYYHFIKQTKLWELYYNKKDAENPPYIKIP